MNTYGSGVWPAPYAAQFLKGELVAALRAYDPDALRSLLTEGIQELGATEMEELLLDWLGCFLALVRAVPTAARFHPSTKPCWSPTSKCPLLI